MMLLLVARQSACEEDAGRPGAHPPHFSPSASIRRGMFDGEQNPLCVFQVWAWAKRRLIKEWPPDRWRITREPTAFSRHPLQCCPGASCLPHPETPPEVSQRSWWMNSSLQLRTTNQLHSETVREVIAEQGDNFKNNRCPCDTNWSTWPSKFSGSLGVVERHFGKMLSATRMSVLLRARHQPLSPFVAAFSSTSPGVKILKKKKELLNYWCITNPSTRQRACFLHHAKSKLPAENAMWGWDVRKMCCESSHQFFTHGN